MRPRTFRPQLESLDVRRLLSFTAGGAYPAGNVPQAIVNADFNNDGHLDLATANGWAGTVSVLLGTGDGSFGTPTQVAAYAPTWLGAGDFNGDGNSDLVTRYYDSWADGGIAGGYGRVEVHLGDGDGTFQPARNVHSTGSASQPIPETVRVADVNGDGRSDLGIRGWYSYAYEDPYNPFPQRPEYFTVLLGNADGSFTQTYRDPSEFPPTPAPDFNGDGYGDKLDFGFQGLGVKLGLPDGTFGSPEYYLQGQSPTAVTVGDFNSDGRPDVVAATYESEDVLVLLNDGIWPPVDAPTIRIGDATVTEGNTGTRAATFTVTLSAASGLSVTVAYATGHGSAAGSDYRAASGTLTFAPGETRKTVTVLVNGDRVGEANETFFVNLGGATNATIADGQSVGTIVDDEPRMAIRDASVVEGASGKRLMTFTVTLSAPYDAPVAVSFATKDGTARAAANDYLARSGSLTFAPGETSKTITIEIIGDRKREADETFFVTLSGAVGALLIDGQGLGTIRNDDR